MEIALLIVLVVALLIAVVELRKELKSCKSDNSEAGEEILRMTGVIADESKQYEKLQDGIQNELKRLKDQVDQFKLERDPDAMFPSMERSIQEANVVANFRMLQRLYKDLT